MSTAETYKLWPYLFGIFGEGGVVREKQDIGTRSWYWRQGKLGSRFPPLDLEDDYL